MGFMQPAADTLPRSTLIIGDSREEAGSGETFAHIYPATGRVTREITLAGPADVDRAVAAARAAFPAWRAMPGDKRRDLMFRLAALLEAKAQELVPSLVSENGSILLGASYMPHDAAQKFRYYGGWADKIEGRTIATWGGPAHDYVQYEPYGVVGAIIPWNGPLFAATMVMAPALAAGNCIVVKSPDLAPYSVMRLVELIQEAGFPAGCRQPRHRRRRCRRGDGCASRHRQDPVRRLRRDREEGARQRRPDAQALRPRARRQVGGDRLRRRRPPECREEGADGRGQRQRPGLRQRHTPAGRTLDLRALPADCCRRWPVTSLSAIHSIRRRPWAR